MAFVVDNGRNYAGNTILRPAGVYSLTPSPQQDGRGEGGDLKPISAVSGIRRGCTFEVSATEAVADLRRQLDQPDLGLVMFFCSSAYDRAELASALDGAFPGALVVGCTTAGEITPFGYRTGSIAAVSLARPVCRAEAMLIDQLSSFAFTHGLDAVRGLLGAMADGVGAGFAGNNTFAMLLIDGMSGAEDTVLSAIHAGLGDIPLFGGSAGDDLKFQNTWVFKDGGFHSDAAVLVLFHTDLPFRVFKTQHFIGSNKKMVITGADPLKRIVTEINAEPAAREFARVVGLDLDELSPMIFATHPVVVKVGGADYVRSIQKVNGDGSLSFFCAIDEGLVLSVGRSVDPFDNLRQVFADLERDIGPPGLVLGCECVLRSLEMERMQMKTRMGEMLTLNNVVGFNTYGEQFNAMHVNQTFTGVALGCRPR
jgi:hypothetical protein